MCKLLYFHSACGHPSYYRYHHLTSSVHACPATIPPPPSTSPPSSSAGQKQQQQQQAQHPCNQIVDEVNLEGYCTTCFMRDFERNRSLVRAMRAAREFGFKIDVEEVKKMIEQEANEAIGYKVGEDGDVTIGMSGLKGLRGGMDDVEIDEGKGGRGPGSMEAQDGSGDDEEDEERRVMRVSGGGGGRMRKRRKIRGGVGVPIFSADDDGGNGGKENNTTAKGKREAG